MFDEMYQRRGEIELAFGESLSWERMDEKRASRIAAYRPGTITSDAAKIEELRRWGVDALIRLRSAIVASIERR